MNHQSDAADQIQLHKFANVPHAYPERATGSKIALIVRFAVMLLLNKLGFKTSFTEKFFTQGFDSEKHFLK